MHAVQQSDAAEQDLLEFYRRVRARTEELCGPLEIEDYIPQPIVDVSPPKWNIAHTTWFFEEMILKQFVPGYEPFDPAFGFLFNSYYNSIGDRTARDRRGDISRPTVKQVFAYRKHVDERMSQLLARDEGKQAALTELVTLGLNHEQQHQELFLTDLKYTFSTNPLLPVYDASFAQVEDIETAGRELIEMPAGIYEIGYNGEGFCFDNELGRQRVFLEDYAISRRLVTNREFKEFIDDGGYRNALLWHSEGWDWVNREHVEAPLYWHDRDGRFFNYTLAGLREVVPDAPVCHVSFYEASAFAEWKGMRLATEFEWEAANDKFRWGRRWEWTNSAYLPYPGFRKGEGAVGEYNGKFMINQMVLRGASVATPAGHSRPTYRNFFHPHLRWQFTGIRLAQ
ncbi:MAG: ergothioneine biosynthesis protein EgtB [Pyrinomonadaceae bacterium]|nr:ergothioneine biosynthesis protein EgtB [Pyrinomonadaceae bacterium]